MRSGKRKILIYFILISCVLWVSAQRRPVIGISDTHRDGTNTAVPRSYVNAVLLTGGIPVVIPLMQDDNEMIELLNSLDGIIFTGGEDFDPSYYNERPIPQMGRVNALRDRFDLRLLKLAAERSIPILGICRGIQLINIAFGGSLYQDLPTQYYDKSIRHRQSQPSEEASHPVIVEDFTVFADIVKDPMLMVNSAHHQAIKDVAKGFRVAGKSSDKIVEVIEKIDDENWILGVQFHPEMRVTRDAAMRRIFQYFINKTGNQRSPDRPDRPLTASVTQTEREPSQESLFNNRPLAASTPDIIYRNVIDTQYIYKIVHDTLYVRVPVPVDTIYFPVYDTVYIAANTTNISPETVNIHYESANTTKKVETANTSANLSTNKVETAIITTDTATMFANPSDTVVIQVSITQNGRESDSVNQAKSDLSVTDTGQIPVQAIDLSENKVNLFESDTLIFTPGVLTMETTAKKSAVVKANNKREEKEKAKQTKKDKKEQEEKDKFEKKLAKAKEKQFEQQQKENAKLDKKELKLRKKQGTAEKE